MLHRISGECAAIPQAVRDLHAAGARSALKALADEVDTIPTEPASDLASAKPPRHTKGELSIKPEGVAGDVFSFARVHAGQCRADRREQVQA